jgi:hypothetical protein
MNYSTGTLGLPIVLLASLWGAINTTLKFFEIINERRDIVFKLIDKCVTCPKQTLGPLEIYLTNIVPLSIGVCIFLALVSYVVVSIPRYMNVEDKQHNHQMKFACNLITILPLFALLGFVGGGIFDAIIIMRSF